MIALPAVYGIYPPGQSYNNYRVLGLHGDGLNNGTDFPEVTGKTVTALGGTITDTGTKKFGSAAIYFGGAAGGAITGTLSARPNLTVPNNIQFSLSNKAYDFRISFWVYVGTLSGWTAYVMGTGTGPANNNTSGDWYISISASGGVTFQIARSPTNFNVTGPAGAVTAGSWHYVEVSGIYNTGLATRTISVFVDGVVGVPQNQSFVVADSTKDLRIGAQLNIANLSQLYGPLNGWMDDIEMLVGPPGVSSIIGANSSNYTPPTSAFID